jgi:cytidine deaminase
MTLSDEERRNLRQIARDVAGNAHAPYSRFRVGAAVLTGKTIHAGTNVENASYGLSLCAERSALSRMVAEGDGGVRAIAVACIDAESRGDASALTPCGACRQWIAELAPDAEILIDGIDRVFTLADLLPFSFTLTRREESLE